jgi:predicted cupin superfamily sugar epimerase
VSGASDLTARAVVEALGLKPHPEGGWYVETFRDETPDGGRAASTAIYYLLERSQVSAWHRIDAVEIWHFHAGAPLELSLAPPSGETSETHALGPELTLGQRPQVIVPRFWWQSARSTGDWTLVGCTVAPGFEFSSFEMAPKGWCPGGGI